MIFRAVIGCLGQFRAVQGMDLDFFQGSSGHGLGFFQGSSGHGLGVFRAVQGKIFQGSMWPKWHTTGNRIIMGAHVLAYAMQVHA